MRRNKPSILSSSPDLKTQVTAIVESFEGEAIPEAEALAQIHELAGKQIDGDGDSQIRQTWRHPSPTRIQARPI